jgi:phospholipid/cholesterol/gamma-HCH transport system substrate-binding protein
MNEGERGIEAKVGAFVFVGLAALAALVVQFGRVGEGWKTYYPLTVRFSDASGLLKGSDVLLAGAKIGRVSGGPRLVSEGQGVAVPLRIYDYVKIPAASKFTVGSSGLLGDRFVAVTMPPGKPTAFLPKNAMIKGTRETGLDDLMREGGALAQDLRSTIARLNHEALSPGNMQNLKASIEHLNQATSALAESSEKIDGVVEKAGATMTSTKQASDALQKAIGDARKTIQAATQVINEATRGRGMLATLLTDQQLAKDLEALISNLRRHGVLFYRDSAAKTEPRAQDLRQSERETRRSRGR